MTKRKQSTTKNRASSHGNWSKTNNGYVGGSLNNRRIIQRRGGGGGYNINFMPKVNIPNPNDNNTISYDYDYAVIGGGPSGIMAAYALAESQPSKSILLLEKGESTLNDYKTEGYDNIFNWQLAQNDADFKNSFMSTDNKNIWLGNGLGGGSLVFGLQYIDTEQVVNDGFQEWKKDPQTGEDILSKVTSILQPQSYSYDDPTSRVSQNAAYVELKEKITSEENSRGVKFCNNKIYASDIENGSRLLVGDKISSMTNIEVKYDKVVKRLSNSTSETVDVEVYDGTKYIARKCILCAGSIQSSAILQRSGVTTGDTLSDHAGFTVLYGKLQQQTTQTTTPYSGDYTFTLTPDTLSKMYAHSNRYVYSLSNVGDDNGNVYDFTDWVNAHPGGPSHITQWVNSNHNLEFPASHGIGENNRSWENNKQRFTLIGILNGDAINYDDLSEEIKSDDLKNALFPDTTADVVTYVPVGDIGLTPDSIIPHVQTRDENNRWQTYYSTVPTLPNYLILTHSQSASLPMQGNVSIKSELNENPEVSLHHFGSGEIDASTNPYIDDIYEAFTKNHAIMTDLGYTLFSPNPQTAPVTKELIKQMASTIYHYTCSNKNVVDANNKLQGMENIYIGDISTLPGAWGGSTSVPALVSGYKTGSIASRLS